MSFFLPAPLTIVVFSFSTVTFLALPSMSSFACSSLMPRSSEIAVPPVRMAMSSSMALRRSPKPGAFRRDFQPAAELVDDQRGERLAFHVFSYDEQRFAGLHHSLEQRQKVVERRKFLFIDQEIGVLH